MPSEAFKLAAFVMVCIIALIVGFGGMLFLLISLPVWAAVVLFTGIMFAGFFTWFKVCR